MDAPPDPRPQTGAPDPRPWRERLARTLTTLSAVLSTVVFIPLALGIASPRIRAVSLTATLLFTAGLLTLSRARVSHRIRAVGVVTFFMLVAVVGQATVGFLGAPATAFASAVVVSGLLLGRRSMFITVGLVFAAMAASAWLMVSGTVPAPPVADISPLSIQNWLRSNALSLALILILGAAVTLVVENIEASARRLEAEARRREQAERSAVRNQATELIGRVAAGLAHDVNNQLTVVGGWTGLLTMSPDPALLQEAHDAISGAVKNAGALTRQLLMLGRKDVRTPRAVSLPKLVEDYRQTLGRLLPPQVELTATLEGEAWCIADEAQLHHVLLNLVLNARDAMPRGGRLEIRTSRRGDVSQTDGHRGPIPEGDWAVLEVRDDGCGMDAETLAQALEPFFTTKPSGQGTGLGLPTIAAIADQSDGHLVIHSAPGSGTTISLWLPATGTMPDTQATVIDNPRASAPVRVLLVEDNRDVLDVASRALVDAGHTVTTATDGDQALDRIATSRFDLLCSDVIMPGAPLDRVLKRFAATNPDAKVLLCSGHVAEAAVRESIEQGHLGFLAKPYRPDQLLAAIDALSRGAEDDT